MQVIPTAQPVEARSIQARPQTARKEPRRLKATVIGAIRAYIIERGYASKADLPTTTCRDLAMELHEDEGMIRTFIENLSRKKGWPVSQEQSPPRSATSAPATETVVELAETAVVASVASVASPLWW